MDKELTLKETKKRIEEKLCDYHNSVFAVCVREKDSWIESNKLLKQIIYLCMKEKDISMNVVKEQLDKAFTPRIKEMLAKKQESDNEK